MSSSSVKKWCIYCNTEQKNIFGYLDDTIEVPTVCFNNNEHSIDTNKTKFIENIFKDTTQLVKWKVYCDTEEIDTFGYTDELIPAQHCFNNKDHKVSQLPVLIEKIYNNTRRIKEETFPTGSNFSIHTIVMDIPNLSSEVIVKDHVFPMPINLLNTFYNTTYLHEDDILEVEVAPNTYIGTLTEDVAEGITAGITVSPSTIEYLNIGYFVDIDIGTTHYELGRCVAIDRAANKISVQLPTPVSFSSGSFVNRTVRFIDDLTLHANHNVVLGANKIGASYFPANTIGRIKYKNINGLAKKFSFGVEYLY